MSSANLSVIARKGSELLDIAVGQTAQVLKQAGAGRRVRFILAGGTSPREIYERWAQLTDIQWAHVEFYFGDERCVPPEHALSNYGMFKKAFLDARPNPLPRVHRIEGELSAEDASAKYRKLIEGVSLFDGALLGIGADCHTASLFPADTHDPNVDVVTCERPDAKRVSLAARVFSRCKRVFFYVPGTSKIDALELVMLEADQPASRIAHSTRSTIYIEEDSKDELNRRLHARPAPEVGS